MSSDPELLSYLSTFYKISMSNVNYNQKLDWCFEHCNGSFRDISYNNGTTVWYFEDSADAVLFAISWE